MFSADFKDLLSELSEAGASYIIIGAYALSVHGVIRATGDLDVWVQPTAENAELVYQALLRFGAPADHFTVDDLAKPDVVLQMGQPPHRIDLLTSISGVEFSTAWSNRVALEFEGLSIPVLGRDDLITNKRATGRTQDLADVEKLEETNGG